MLKSMIQIANSSLVAGSAQGTKITFDKPIFFAPGSNKIDLLSATVGLQVIFPIIRRKKVVI